MIQVFVQYAWSAASWMLHEARPEGPRIYSIACRKCTICPRALRIVLQADFNLTYAQLGLLPALYMAGLMVACLVFNELTNHVNSFRLVGGAQELPVNSRRLLRTGHSFMVCLIRQSSEIV